jgi:hypothetical protein
MAFFTLGRRKRRVKDEHDCDGSDAGELHQPGGALAGYVVDESGALIPADEVHLPRWRRPSLMAARKGSAAVSPDELVASRLTFEHAAVRPEPMHERRYIRYRMVRVGDRPDEILSIEIGRLDQGDEVELLESRGAFWKVRVPTGLIGWIHRTTLAEAAPAPSAASPGEPWNGASDALSGGNHGHNGNGTDSHGNGTVQHAGNGNGHANGTWPHPNGNNGNGSVPACADPHHGNGTGSHADGTAPHSSYGQDGAAGSPVNGTHVDGLSELTGLSDDALAARLAAAEAMLGDSMEGDITEGLAARLIRERQRGGPH